jgi:hypothetical protein
MNWKGSASGHGAIKVLFQHLSEGNEANHENPQPEQPVGQTKFKASTS